MQNSLRETYKVEKNNIEKMYEYHLALKNNKEFEKVVDDTFLAFANLLKTIYPDIKIEAPRGREKSNQSLKNKIEKLEIERLCKLNAIGEIKNQEIRNLYNLVLNKLDNVDKSIIKKILIGEIKTLQELDQIMKMEQVESHTKTALLRIVNTRLIKEDKKDLQIELDEKYGKKAAEKTKQLKNNLLHWECIENLNDETIKKLHSPEEYLQVKDIRGFKFVVVDVPENLNTDNEKLKDLLKKRSESTGKEKTNYKDLCCIELTKDFVKKIANNKELLKQLNIEVLKDGYKHKQKQNGYIAEHIKFCDREHPQYVFEMQLRSIYREDISRANGVAAHDKRSGKKRVFPSIEKQQEFIKELENTVPQYKTLKKTGNEFELYKCNIAENMLEYYLGYVKLDSEEYKTALEYIKKTEETEKQK